jgi:hypothetical protein
VIRLVVRHLYGRKETHEDFPMMILPLAVDLADRSDVRQ